MSDLDALGRLLSLAPGQDQVDPLAALHSARPAWHTAAACRGHDPALWFPTRGQPSAPAKAICATCPAADPCLDWALDQGDDLAGVWAGTSRHDRARIRSEAA